MIWGKYTQRENDKIVRISWNGAEIAITVNSWAETQFRGPTKTDV